MKGGLRHHTSHGGRGSRI